MIEPQGSTIKASEFLSGSGEVASLMRSSDWTHTSLGPPEKWPESLKTVVRIMLDSRYAIWIGWGPELSFLYNDAYRAMTLGKKHPWALGRPAREVWAEAWSDLGPRVEEVVQHGQATYDEDLFLLLERSGFAEETYHTFSYSPLPDDNSNIGGLLCIVVEDTNRYIAERRLTVLRETAAQIANTRDLNELFGAIARCAGANLYDLPFSLIYLAEPDGSYARLMSHTGIGLNHPAAAGVIKINAPDQPWPISEVLARAEPVLISDPAKRFPALPSGQWDVSPHSAAAVPIAHQGQEQPAGVLIAGLSPYRPFDDSYRGFINLLAGQIAAGLADVRAYEEEKKRAEALAEIDRAKTTFFSNASHEFRTPLTLMLSPLEELLERSGDRDSLTVKRGEIELIHRNGLRLLRLANTLLDFSRIEAGRFAAVYEPADLATYTAELASTFRSAMEKAGLRYVVDCPPLGQPVYIDRDMWEKIVLNLLSNAFKYTLEGEVTVALHLQRGGKNAELVVRDTGAGIPAREIPRLFERFHRIEGQPARTHEGTGIGLALVDELVRLQGGSIRVESTPGKGSAFTVEMPLGTAHLPSDRVANDRSRASTEPRAQAFIEEALRWLPSERLPELPIRNEPVAYPPVSHGASGSKAFVLVADDNADMRDYLRHLLDGFYEVEAVNDGQAALDTARRRKPDLVLSDIMMPRLDGFGLLRALRGDAGLRDVPVILLSARAGEEASVEGLEAGADDYLVKPFGARELLARVRAKLEMAALRREAVQVENELRREAQAARDFSEGILASINDGFMALGADWCFTYVNPAAERLIGRSGAALMGKNYWKEYPGTLGTVVEISFRRAMSERVSVAFEYYSALLRRWLDVRAYPARDGGLSIYTQDITDRKHAEDAARRLNEMLEVQVAERTAELVAKETRLRTMFETSFTYQGLMTLDGTLLDTNATSLASIQASLEDVAGKPFWETPWFTGTPGMSARVRAAIPLVAGGEVVRQEIYLNLPAEGWRWFDFQMRPMRDAQGAIVALVPEAVDITARRQAEEALRQAHKMEAIGQLTGGVAHDFNNLLQIIVGNLYLLQQRIAKGEFSEPDYRRLVERGIRGAQRAATLTQRLLAFSRRQPLDPKPLDANRLVTRMSELLQRTLGENINIETVLAGGLWRTFADASELENALLNLAVNARDAMPEGGRLTIETANAWVDDAYA
ncbi:MAG: ATP-binding protein, partial [Candidatus Binataceae bacterium]